MTVGQALQEWHDLYMTAGAAAAALVGLLFVGLSLHIRVVATHSDIRALARVTLTDFFVVLLISLVLLQPADNSTQIGLWLIVVAGVSLLLILRPVVLGIVSQHGRTIDPRRLAIRFGVSALAILLIGVAGLFFATSDFRDGLDSLLPFMIMLLVIAVRNTWDLMVTVAQRSGPT